jgi:hypothetical protein
MKRSTILGAVLATALTSTLITTPTQATELTSDRSGEPVVVTGADIFGILGSRLQGVPVEDITAHSWNGSEWRRIPSQIDERRDVRLAGCGFFNAYSGADVQNTYDYDGQETNGFDADDELVFMLGDAGQLAPESELPEGASARTDLQVTDPVTKQQVWVSLVTGATATAPDPYVTYQSDDPDNSADIGCNKDSGYNRNDLIATTGYQMHFDSRWGIDSIRIRTGANDAPGTAEERLLATDGLGPDVIDRWKGRAYAGDGSSQTEWYWSQHSTMLGTIVGPVRVIRATNGAASGTNVTRTIIAYPNTFRQEFVLHLHPMPPEGFYGYWDMDCSKGDWTFYNSLNEQGVPVDGVPDPVGDIRDDLAHQYPLFYSPRADLIVPPVGTQWEQISGPNGGWVGVWSQPKPVRGLVSGYYRDDHSYNDRTGSLPEGAQGSCGSFGMHAHLADDSDGPGPTGEAGLSPLIENIIRQEHYVTGPNTPNVGAAVQQRHDNPVEVSAIER